MVLKRRSQTGQVRATGGAQNRGVAGNVEHVRNKPISLHFVFCLRSFWEGELMQREPLAKGRALASFSASFVGNRFLCMVFAQSTSGSAGILRLSPSPLLPACRSPRPRKGHCRGSTLPHRLRARQRSVSRVKGWTTLHCDSIRSIGPAAMHNWAVWAGAAAAVWILYKLVRFSK